MLDDATRWDLIHKKTQSDSQVASNYAEEKEVLFPRGSLVVELGAGTGADALFFLRKGHSVVALDISEFALKQLQENANKENFSKKLVVRKVDFGLHDLPIKDASVDVVYSRISLNYFDSDHTTKLFGDIYKILKPGGVSYLTFKSPDDSEEMQYLGKTAVIFEPNVYIDNGMLRSRFSKEQLEIMLKGAIISSFEVKKYQEDLSSRGEGHKSILFVNEVTFTKPKG